MRSSNIPRTSIAAVHTGNLNFHIPLFLKLRDELKIHTGSSQMPWRDESRINSIA